MGRSTPVPFLSLILPAYNEVTSISGTLRDIEQYVALKGFPYQIIVSADGNDGTRELVADLAKHNSSLSVIGSSTRGGKGLGIRRAIPLAYGQIVGIVDADNKTPITELDKVLPLFEEGYDLVIGSRALPGAVIERRQPLYRQIGSHGFGVFMHLVTGLNDIVDSQCGFKFFQQSVAQDLFSRQKIDGYMYDVEILFLAKKLGYRIAQVPIHWHDDGDSRLQLFSGNVRNVIDVFRIRLASHAVAGETALRNQLDLGQNYRPDDHWS